MCALWGSVLLGRRLRNHVGRPLQKAKMHTRKILAHDAENQKLHSGENGDDGREKREAGHGITFNKASHEDEQEYATAKKREQKSDEAGDA